MNSSAAPLKPECARGWFAAGKMLEAALSDLSDGAFKLFVDLCLQAQRQTGSICFQQARLASRLGKSRRSIGIYLKELVQKGYCSLQPCLNQHGGGTLTIAESYWPYQRTSVAGLLDPQTEYIQQVRKLFLDLVPAATAFSDSDHCLAGRWFSQSVPLPIVEKALLLGSLRKQITRLNNPADPPIRSLHYFQPLLQEVQQTQVNGHYWDHLRDKLQKLVNPSQGQDPSPQPQTLRPSSHKQEVVPC
jgi:hypothetical protein